MIQHKITIISLFFLLFGFSAKAQSVIGTWKTIDDKTGKAKSHVTLYKENDKVYGKITKLLLKPDDTTCDKCPGDRKDKLLIGMVILSDLHQDGKYWKGGKILDPDNGKTYTCKIWLDSQDKLSVRGYIGPFYRTQSWYRID